MSAGRVDHSGRAGFGSSDVWPITTISTQVDPAHARTVTANPHDARQLSALLEVLAALVQAEIARDPQVTFVPIRRLRGALDELGSLAAKRGESAIRLLERGLVAMRDLPPEDPAP